MLNRNTDTSYCIPHNNNRLYLFLSKLFVCEGSEVENEFCAELQRINYRNLFS